MPPVWRAPEGTEGQAAVLMGGGGAGAGSNTISTPDAASVEGQAALPMGGGGAWPGFETTRRAKLAARTARGRAAAHGHTEQPGPTKHTQRPEHQRRKAPHQRAQAYKKPTSGSDVGLWWS